MMFFVFSKTVLKNNKKEEPNKPNFLFFRCLKIEMLAIQLD